MEVIHVGLWFLPQDSPVPVGMKGGILAKEESWGRPPLTLWRMIDSVVLAPSRHCWVPQPFHQWAPVAAPWTGHTYGTCARCFTVALSRLIEVLERHLPTALAADS